VTDKVTGELSALCSSPNIIRIIRWVQQVARWGKGEVHAGFWAEKPEGKSALGIPRRRWEYNIQINLQNKVLGHLAQDRDRWLVPVNAVTNLRVPQNASLLVVRFTAGNLDSET
jgi:hypothetical protein